MTVACLTILLTLSCIVFQSSGFSFELIKFMALITCMPLVIKQMPTLNLHVKHKTWLGEQVYVPQAV